MHQRTIGFVVTVVVLALVGGAVLTKQREQTFVLRGQLESARSAAEEVQRLRDENVRLLRQQIPASELETLRADHDALARLRTELNAMGRN